MRCGSTNTEPGAVATGSIVTSLGWLRKLTPSLPLQLGRSRKLTSSLRLWVLFLFSADNSHQQKAQYPSLSHVGRRIQSSDRVNRTLRSTGKVRFSPSLRLQLGCLRKITPSLPLRVLFLFYVASSLVYLVRTADPSLPAGRNFEQAQGGSAIELCLFRMWVDEYRTGSSSDRVNRTLRSTGNVRFTPSLQLQLGWLRKLTPSLPLWVLFCLALTTSIGQRRSAFAE